MFQHPKRSWTRTRRALLSVAALAAASGSVYRTVALWEPNRTGRFGIFSLVDFVSINDVQNIWLQNDRLCAEIRETLDCQKRGWNSKLISVCWSLPESDAAAFAYTLQGGVGAAQMELSEESKIPRTFFFGWDSRFWHGLTVFSLTCSNHYFNHTTMIIIRILVYLL